VCMVSARHAGLPSFNEQCNSVGYTAADEKLFKAAVIIVERVYYRHLPSQLITTILGL